MPAPCPSIPWLPPSVGCCPPLSLPPRSQRATWLCWGSSRPRRGWSASRRPGRFPWPRTGSGRSRCHWGLTRGRSRRRSMTGYQPSSPPLNSCLTGSRVSTGCRSRAPARGRCGGACWTVRASFGRRGGGRPIDVCKIELVQRSPDEHRLLWRTVSSLNGSATWDDGSLTFTDLGVDGTRATVRGRQLFTLPRAWSGIDLDLLPELKAPLVQDAYRRFFTATFDNLEACFEGRPFRIGRTGASGDEPLGTEMLYQLIGLAKSWLEERSAGDTSLFAGPTREQPDEVDLRGFSHFTGAR